MKNLFFYLKLVVIASIFGISMLSCTSNSKKSASEQYVEDYNKGSNLEILDSKFADAQRRLKAMLPMEIDEYTTLTDFQLTDNSVIYCCTLSFDGDFSDIDFSEIDKEQESDIKENIKSEQIQLLLKYCKCTGRDLRYVYYSMSGKKIHEQVIKPADYLIQSE